MRARDRRGAFLLPILLASAGTAAANPSIVGNASDARCVEALHMATAAFRSDSPSLLWPIAQPSRGTMKIVLRQNDADISGGQAIEADPSQFDALRQQVRDDYAVTTFWAKQVSAGKRLALVDQPHGWRGDWYAVFRLEPDTTPEQFAEQLKAWMDGGDAVVKPELGDSRWNPPIVLMDTQSGDYWLIDRGEPYEIMADWRIHAAVRDGLSTLCRISFGLSDSDGLTEMPLAVRGLAAALDEALGPETSEGTLRPTARVRLEVARGWANAALRPWSFTAEPYNTRTEVDQGLADWAKGNARRAALRERIARSYSAAELALARYYASRFKDDPSARDLGRRVLDQMFRRYFVFSKSAPTEP